MENAGSALGGGAEDVLPEFVRAGEGFLVGGNDADAALEEDRVGIGDVLGARVVDENGLVAGGGEVGDQVGEGQRGLG